MFKFLYVDWRHEYAMIKQSTSLLCVWKISMSLLWFKFHIKTCCSFKISSFKVSTLCSISLWLILRLTSAGGSISRMIYVNFDFPADLASRNVLWVWLAYWVSPIWGFTSVKIQILDGKLREKLKAEYLHNFVSRRTLTC